ncbi:type I-E CRISPR-associated protein Cas7/Cse4/CasC [Methylocaldum sp. GT1BB]|jgi:CRISPR system Cascade subunit CasC|uniref:type I-E CRISPR-associated protein Cas7/Cse4/CasC n=1 Tax=Methylocaldum sp. GT1BB TaxID=3438963 RepID=UPI003D9FE358
MTQFIQLHFLTSYPPSNLNRDDTGKPKTAKMGGEDRLRISSQSLKRAWRVSDLFKESLDGHIGTRTKLLGVKAYDRLQKAGISVEDALEWAKAIADKFGKLKSLTAEEKRKAGSLPEPEKIKVLLKELEIEQLVHVSRSEQEAIDALVDKLAHEKRAPDSEELGFLTKDTQAVDIALFGRMLASKPIFNVEAAAQVAHAITVHRVAVEDDYFTAVDDLNTHELDAGSAHIGEFGFAAGLFYLYLCINRDLLIKNLSGNEELARKAIAGLISCAAKIAPSGKQNSYASRAHASYALAEKGPQQPRSLSVAFLKPITGVDMLNSAIQAMERQQKNMDQVYGPCADERYYFNVEKENGVGSLKALIEFAAR